MPPPAASGMASKPVRASPVIVSVTGVLGPTPVMVDVNGAPAAGVASDTVKVNPGGVYAMAADGARMRAAAAAATKSARRIMARSPAYRDVGHRVGAFMTISPNVTGVTLNLGAPRWPLPVRMS